MLNRRTRSRLRRAGFLTAVVMISAACSTPTPEDRADEPSAGARATPDPADQTPAEVEKSPDESPPATTRQPQAPAIRPVPLGQWEAMQAAGMVRPECPVSERSELRRVDLDYVDFGGELRRGHLVVNRDIAESTARIFTRLVRAEFPIRRMEGVENYEGDTLASLQADNTSAYNCRRLDQTNAPVLESPHANGRAIDVNPRENPWMDLRCDCWSPGPRYAARTPGPGKVIHGNVAWQAFDDEGWIWQNIDVADYMHFDTGYPSVPFTDPG